MIVVCGQKKHVVEAVGQVENTMVLLCSVVFDCLLSAFQRKSRFSTLGEYSVFWFALSTRSCPPASTAPQRATERDDAGLPDRSRVTIVDHYLSEMTGGFDIKLLRFSIGRDTVPEGATARGDA